MAAQKEGETEQPLKCANEEASFEDSAMPRSPWVGALRLVLKYNTVLIFFVMIGLAASLSDVFFSRQNIFNLLRQVAGLAGMGLGMLLVILTGGIDLSVGSLAAFTSVLVASLLGPVGLLPAVGLTISAGALCGAVSGYLVAARRMAPFIATLAMMTIARGFAFILSKGSPIIIAEPRLNQFGSAYWLGVPAPVFVMLAIFALVAFLLRYTVFGRMVTAIGSNEAAVRLAGVRTRWYKFAVYCISGAFCAVAGIISTSRTGVGSPIVGAGAELDAIAAVVIGGASLSGGKGTAFNTLLGVLILGIIGNIMNLMNIPGYPQQVVKGLIIVGAVLLQGWQRGADA
jgi:ribose transport system permease protein